MDYENIPAIDAAFGQCYCSYCRWIRADVKRRQDAKARKTVSNAEVQAGKTAEGTVAEG